MRRILQINSVVNWGSTGRIVEEIGHLAMEQGWKSYVAYGRGAGKSKSTLIKIGNKLDNYLHLGRTRLWDGHGFGSKKSTINLIKQIEKIQPDIVHLHNLHGYYVNIEFLFNFLAEYNVPVVWTLHDCWAFTGHCAYYSFVSCDKWKYGCNKCPQKKSYPSSLLMDNSIKNYEIKKNIFNSISDLTIVPVSKWLENEVNQSFLSSNKIEVINNGIDLNIFKNRINLNIRNKYNLKNKFVILGVANIWNKRKGLHDFIEMSKSLKKDEIILLIGLNKYQLKDLPNNIIGLNRTNDILELAEFYSMADLFINPSTQETFGLTTAESLACGTPALVYNATASPEIINQETGFVIDSGDISGIISIIEKMRESKESYYSELCRKRVSKLYNKDEKYMEYFNLYDELLKS